MTIVGAVFVPDLPPERLRSIATAADEAGLDELWLWEDCFREGGMTSAAAALAWTANLRVGVGVFPVPLRNAAIAAMEIATLSRMFGDRAIVGLGHGVLDWMAQVGARAESPMTLLREYASAVRALLHGDTLSTTGGRYVRLDNVALNWPPEVAPPIHIAGASPKTLRLAGEVGDGTILDGSSTPDAVRRAVALAAEGRAAAGRDGTQSICVYVPIATGPDAEARIARGREEWGANVGHAGDADTLAEALREFADAGADRVIAQPTSDEPDPEGFVRFVATELAPRLRA